MATAYTSLLGLALPVTGELQGTWGTTVNDAITSLLDTAVAGTTTLNTDSDVTLSTTTGAANQARQAIILWTANGTVTRNITAPAQSKAYVVINATAGTQSIVIRGVGPTSGVTLLAGEKAIVAWNGSDFVKVSTFGGSPSFTNVTITGTTTLSGLTASTALALNASKEVVSVTNTGTGDNVLSASPTLTGTVAGASLQLSSLTSGRVTYAGASGLLQDSASLTFDGTTLSTTTVDATNVEVTNVKAKDGTAAATIADSTGVVTVSQAPVMSALTASQAVFTTAGKALVSNAITGSGNVVMSASPTLTGTVAGASLQLSSLTSGRVTYAGASGLLQDSANLTFNGTDLTVSGAVNAGTVNATTFDMTNLEVTNIKAKDGTAAASIADSTGIITVSTQLNVDNLNLSDNTLSSTDANGNIVLAPNGTGDVQLDADTVRIGDANANATLTTNGTGDLILNTNAGTNSGSITIADAANGDISLVPNGNGSVVITNAGTSNALRITQTGSGNALLVEDSANPDATPFVVDASGNVGIGISSPGTAAKLEIEASGAIRRAGATPEVSFWRSSGTITSPTIVSSGDVIGRIYGVGYDGTNYINAARIQIEVDNTPGTNDMPGRLVFSTTADGASTPTERLRIDSAGQVGVGGLPTTGYTLSASKNVTGSTSSGNFVALGNTLSDVTANSKGFATFLGTQAASFTLTNLLHFEAQQGTIGASSAITNQYGYFATATLTGATNNFGFYSNIASGTGRWNFYANGTADNFFGGPTTISVNSSSNALRITQTGAGNALVVEDSANPDATPFVVDASGNVGIGDANPAGAGAKLFMVDSASTGPVLVARNSTTDANGVNWYWDKVRTSSVVASGDVLARFNYRGFDGSNFIIGARIEATVDGTPGTNDMPGRLVFSTTADGASTPTERVRIDSAGNVGIGTSSSTLARLTIGGTYTDSSGNVQPIRVNGVSPSTNTSSYFGITHQLNTTAASYTLPTASHFLADQGTIGSGSVITNQYGYFAGATLIGATNNFGFYSNIASGTGRWNFYANGTAQNYFAGNTLIGTTTNTNSSALVVNGSISETVSSVQYLVASQYDVGTDPNEIPVNGYLGALAFMDSQFQQLAVGTGITGGTGTICKTSSGMEGGISVTRILIDLTGLNSGGTAGDIIGVDGTANPCYILALPSVTVLGGRMTCLEAPAGGDNDIDLYSATEGTGVEDQAITALTETQLINGGVQALGTVTYFAADPTFNGYLYLVGQGTANATYTAGRFLIEIFGVQP